MGWTRGTELTERTEGSLCDNLSVSPVWSVLFALSTTSAHPIL
jgi:hypothetical protein